MGSGQPQTIERIRALAEAQLRDTGMRPTAARINVLATLLNASSALTHQELLARLAGIDRVTLYRALDSLITVGLSHKIAGGDRAFRYGAGAIADSTQATDHQHGHFKCTGCGKVFCLNSTARKRNILQKLQKSLEGELDAGFQSHNIELTLKGWCAECAR